jgi:kynureninase
MDENSKFIAHPGAEGWQVSNPPIFSMAPLRTSLEIFDEAGIAALRERSIRLTGYLEQRIDSIGADHYQIITPRDPERRGAQISIRVIGDASALQQSLEEAGITTDFRPPDVVRIAPTPLYNTFEEIHRFTEVLESVAQIGSKRGRD